MALTLSFFVRCFDCKDFICPVSFGPPKRVFSEAAVDTIGNPVRSNCSNVSISFSYAVVLNDVVKEPWGDKKKNYEIEYTNEMKNKVPEMFRIKQY